MKNLNTDPEYQRLALCVEAAYLTEAEAEEAATLAAQLRISVRLEEVYEDIWKAHWCGQRCSGDEEEEP